MSWAWAQTKTPAWSHACRRACELNAAPWSARSFWHVYPLFSLFLIFVPDLNHNLEEPCSVMPRVSAVLVSFFIHILDYPFFYFSNVSQNNPPDKIKQWADPQCFFYWRTLWKLVTKSLIRCYVGYSLSDILRTCSESQKSSMRIQNIGYCLSRVFVCVLCVCVLCVSVRVRVCWQWWMSFTSEQSASVVSRSNHKSLQETCFWKGPPMSDVVLSERLVLEHADAEQFSHIASVKSSAPGSLCGWCLQALTCFFFLPDPLRAISHFYFVLTFDIWSLDSNVLFVFVAESIQVAFLFSPLSEALRGIWL